MKIILSRKGFDTSYGKGCSPILPDGEMLSMPIPASDNESGIQLKDLNFAGKTYLHYADQLYPKLDFPSYHFDPDLNRNSLGNRHPAWKGAFGQAYAAQSHLENEVISKGDLFLFFGSFRSTYLEKGILNWEAQYPFHAIFGYLEVGEIITADEIKANSKNEIYKGHPHFANAKIYDRLNALYVASDKLSGTLLPGSGTFIYNDQLRLTKTGYSKSVWELPNFFAEESISISRHKARDRYRETGKSQMLLSTVGIGQDFVINDASGRVEDWSRKIIATTQLQK